MKQIAVGAATKSEKMRRLAASGYSRQEIADFLGVRYQFVRNVLVQQEKKQGHVQNAFAEAGQSWPGDKPGAEAFAAVRVAPDGSAVIPASILAEAGLRAGDFFVPDVAGEGDVRLLSGNAALRRAQELVRGAIQGKAGLVDEILQERRRDASNLAWDAEDRGG